MKATFIQLPGVTSSNQAASPIAHEAYDDRLASWDGLIGYFSPEHLLTSNPVTLLDRAGDQSVSQGAGQTPTLSTLNGHPAFAFTGAQRLVSANQVIPKTCTLVFAINISAVSNTGSPVLKLPGSDLTLQNNGTQPALTSYAPTFSVSAMAPGTYVLGTTAIFVWAFDEANNILQRQVNAVIDSVANLSSKVNLATRAYDANSAGTGLSFKLGKLCVFDRNLFLIPNSVLKADVLDFFKTYYGVSF